MRILEAVREDPLILREHINRHNLNPCSKWNRSAYSETHSLPCHKGEDFKWNTIALRKAWPLLCDEAPAFLELFARTRSKCPPPWHLVLYLDGITPGNPLAPEVRRKAVVWYASILEFGTDRLCYTEAWTPVAYAYQTEVKEVRGGISALSRSLLCSLYLGPGGLSTAGVNLPSAFGAMQAIPIEFGALLADEEALTRTWNIMGASGMIPCGIKCSCTNKPIHTDIEAGIASLADRDPDIVDIGCADKAKMGLRSDEDVWAICDMLTDARHQPGFKEKQTYCGIKYCPDSLMFCKELRRFIKPSTSNRFDPMHVIWSNGTLNLEIMLFMEALLKKRKLSFSDLTTYASQCGWTTLQEVPPRLQRDVCRCFHKDRVAASHELLKASASELLVAGPLLRDFILQKVPAGPDIERERDSILVLCEACDLLKQVMFDATLPANKTRQIANELNVAASVHLQAFMLAYGKGKVRVKHHEEQHLGDQILADLVWPSAI